MADMFSKSERQIIERTAIQQALADRAASKAQPQKLRAAA